MKRSIYNKVLKAARAFAAKNTITQCNWGVYFNDVKQYWVIENDCACPMGAALVVNKFDQCDFDNTHVNETAAGKLLGLSVKQINDFTDGFDDNADYQTYTRNKHWLAGRRMRDTLVKEGLLEL